MMDFGQFQTDKTSNVNSSEIGSHFVENQSKIDSTLILLIYYYQVGHKCYVLCTL